MSAVLYRGYKHQLTVSPSTRTGKHQGRLVGETFNVSKRILFAKVILHIAKLWSTLPWMWQMMEVHMGSREALVGLKRRNEKRLVKTQKSPLP